METEPKVNILPASPIKKEASPILTINTGAGFVATYEIYNLVSEKDPILFKPTDKFNFTSPQINAIHLAHSMFKTLFHLKGLGLSANQVGIPYSVFVCGVDDNNKQVFFNPEITDFSKENEVGLEGCLSYDLLYLKVPRPKWIKVKWQHVNGEEKEGTYVGLTARIIAHEIDHLNGIVFTSKVGKTSLKLAREKMHKLEKKVDRGQITRK